MEDLSVNSKIGASSEESAYQFYNDIIDVPWDIQKYRFLAT